MIDINFDSNNRTIHCVFKGRMDSLATSELEGEFNRRLLEITSSAGNNIRVIFDLAGVDYIASAFIRLCLQTVKSIEGGNFSVKNTSPMIMKTFKIAGLESLLHVS